MDLCGYVNTLVTGRQRVDRSCTNSLSCCITAQNDVACSNEDRCASGFLVVRRVIVVIRKVFNENTTIRLYDGLNSHLQVSGMRLPGIINNDIITSV